MDDFHQGFGSFKEDTFIRSFRMKPMKRLGMVVLKFSVILGALQLSAANATSAINLACPDKFIATVTNVEDIEVNSAFPKEEVDFQIIQTLKGDKITNKKIQVVKGGPIKFKSGEIYTVESHDSWLCSATLFSKM